MKPQRLDPKAYSEMGQIIRRQILEMYTPDSCIASTRATVSALKLLGVNVYPLSVQVVVMNRPLYEYATLHGGFPAIESPEYPPQGYALQITEHVVAIAERRWLLDYSIDQANRPQYGIDLIPLVVPVTEDWLRGRGGHVVFRHNDSFLYYTAYPGDRWYESSPNWSGDSRPGVTIKAERKSEQKRRLVK
jgi:hypothetical protein